MMRKKLKAKVKQENYFPHDAEATETAKNESFTDFEANYEDEMKRSKMSDRIEPMEFVPKIAEEEKRISFSKICLAIVAGLTLAFTAAMIWVYLTTGQEMATLTERWFTAVFIELGVLMAKRITDNFTNDE